MDLSTDETTSGILDLAMQSRSCGNYDEALSLYQQLLAILIDKLKAYTKGSEDYNKLFSTINDYFNEAEKIKIIIANKKTNITNNSSSNSNNNVTSSNNNINNQKKKNVPDNYNYHINNKATKLNNTNNNNNNNTNNNNTNKIPLKANNANENKKNEYEIQILEEMLEQSPNIKWSDIAGLQFAKQTLQEAVILPNLRPDLFTGLRAPPKGVLLFGPPVLSTGTGKTLLAKAVATESKFSFFSISSSSVTSKYLGEGEKLMKALFSVARQRQPSVIFFDEIDAIMSTRKDNEHEASRRLKTEFMTQLDGATTNSDDRLLVMAATNLPWELDEAVLRRLVKRIYVPLPDNESRYALICHLLTKQQTNVAVKSNPITESVLARIVHLTQGYSASDLTALCKEAAMGPIREMSPELLKTVKAEDLRPVVENDFKNAMSIIRPSVSHDSLAVYMKWAEQYAALR